MNYNQGGIVSITHCGGPTISFSPGRIDARISTSPVGLIPEGDETYTSVRAKLTRMGFSDIDVVALVTGSHTMGGVHAAISPTLTNQTFVPFDSTPGIFDNDVFKQTLNGYCPLPFDCAVATDPTLRGYVQLYAANQTAFFEQYAKSYSKMVALGRNLATTVSVSIPVHANLVPEGSVASMVSSSIVASSTNPARNSGGGNNGWIAISVLVETLVMVF